MKRSLPLLLVLVLLAFVAVRAEFPRPSPYPITWELKFEHGPLRRLVIEEPGSKLPHPYWYMTYTVTNNSDKEQTFLPIFELMTKDGKVIRSDKNIPNKVFDAIKAREKKKFLEPYPQIAGEIRLGEDQARDGVAIWPEPMSRMGEFSIFVGGLSGEVVIMKDDKGEPIKDTEGKPVIVRKTLQLNFKIPGDEVKPGEDQVIENPSEWVMR